MGKIDPEREKQRLAEFYAGQLDGELEKVAGEAYELSDLAREALKAELAKRGLSAGLVEHAPIPVRKLPEPGDPPEQFPENQLPDEEFPRSIEDEENRQADEQALPDVVTIRKFRDLPEALLAKGSLESAGIECALADDNMVRMDWFYSNAIGGIKLLVNAANAAEAEQVLSQPIPEHLDVSGVGEVQQPRCPKCGSLDIGFRESQPAAYLSMVLNVPIPFRKRAWHCQSCNVEWEDEGEAESTETGT